MKPLSERLLESANLKESHVSDDGFTWFINSDEVRCLLHEAEKIVRMVEEALVVELTAQEAYTIGWWPEGSGQRVRIVLDKEG